MLVITLATMPFIIRRFGVELFGIYTLIGVIIGYFSFLQLGIGSASVKYISQYLAEKDDDKIRKVFWSSVLVYCAVGVLGMTFIAALAPLLAAKFLNIPAALVPVSITALTIGAVGFLVSMGLAVVTSTLQALGRFDLLNRVGIFLGTVLTAGTVVLLYLGFSLREVIAFNVLAQAAAIYAYGRLVMRIAPYLARPSWDLSMIGTLFKFGGPVTISSVIAPILLHVEKIFLTMCRSVAALTYYSVGFSIAGRLSVIPSAFSTVLFPAFSYGQGSKDIQTGRKLHYTGTLLIFFSYAYFLAFFCVFGRAFLALWLGNDFAKNSAAILVILVCAGAINATAWPSLVALQGMGRPHIPAAFHLIEAVLYLPSSYMLIRAYGGLGAAAAWLARVSLDAVLMHAASCRLFGRRLAGWYATLIYRGVVPLCACWVGLWLLRRCALPLLHPVTLCGLIVTLAVYVCSVWTVGIDRETRQRLTEYLKAKIQPAGR